MKSEIILGTTPTCEDCAQVGSPDYWERAAEEAGRFLSLLKLKFPDPPKDAQFMLKTFKHDFGNYLTVVLEFDDSNPDAIKFALCVENNLPVTWYDTSEINWRTWEAEG